MNELNKKMKDNFIEVKLHLYMTKAAMKITIAADPAVAERETLFKTALDQRWKKERRPAK